MELLVAALTEDECFSVFRSHQLLPESLSFCDIFQFPYVMNLEWSLLRIAVFALASIESLDDF